MEEITISGLKVSSLIGVYDWERMQQTTLLVDVSIKADLSQARRSDNVTDTIDYARLAEFVQQHATRATFELLEALGHSLCHAILNAFAVQEVTLAITKPNILADAQAVTVVISASR